MSKVLLIYLLTFTLKVFATNVSIENIMYSGSGCPDGSLRVEFSPDFSSFTVLYDQFNLQAGGGSSEVRENCEIQIWLKKPRLMGFSVESADFRGFIYLDQGVLAEQVVNVGASPSAQLRPIITAFGLQRWDGPINQNYVLSAIRPIKAPPVLNCVPFKETTKLIIKSDLRIKGAVGAKQGILSVDSTDGKLAQRFHLKWQDCTRSIIDLFN